MAWHQGRPAAPLVSARAGRWAWERRSAARRAPERGSSPFFPVKTSERTRRCSGVGPPSFPLLASLGPGLVLTPDAGLALGVARTRGTASDPSARGRGSRRHTRAARSWLHPTHEGALWSGGGPPPTPAQLSSRCAQTAKAGGAPGDDAGGPPPRRPDTGTRRGRCSGTAPAAPGSGGALPHRSAPRAGQRRALGRLARPAGGLSAAAAASGGTRTRSAETAATYGPPL